MSANETERTANQTQHKEELEPARSAAILCRTARECLLSGRPIEELIALAPGTILVARRRLSALLFVKSVVLVVRYDNSGALDLMVNRRITVPISRVLSGWKAAVGKSGPVFVGGPVDLHRVFALVRAPQKPDGTKPSGDIYFTNAKTPLEDALDRTSNPNALRFASSPATADGARTNLNTRFSATVGTSSIAVKTWHLMRNPGHSGQGYC